MRFGLSFGLTSKEVPKCPNPHVMYWGGAGGSTAVMDVDEKLSYSYVMNKMGASLVGDLGSAGLATWNH